MTATHDMPMLNEISSEGRRASDLGTSDVPDVALSQMIPARFLRNEKAKLPEIAELAVVRHFTRLSRRNGGIDNVFYPLGSCTMKYNPRVNEYVAAMNGFANIHPLARDEDIQGALELMSALESYLCELTGFSACSLQPAAGAQGEMTALLVIKAYMQDKGHGHRNVVLIPDSAHGTNPASCTACGFKTREVKSNGKGMIDLDDLRAKLDGDVAAMMITNPNTLGIFEANIRKIADILHESGAQLYMDGANFNAIMGVIRTRDMGVDVQHFNLHKTFSTPHGGGGPGAGPIAVAQHLSEFLPIPRIEKREGKFVRNYDKPKTVGRVRAFFGNFGVFVRAYTYIRSLGKSGLRRVAEMAVLNARYLHKKLGSAFETPYTAPCMHEFVVSAEKQSKKGCGATPIAKRLIDYGYHPPTTHFPLIVHDALMIEPTETENRETLDGFANDLCRIAAEIEETPDVVRSAPQTTVVRKLDEVGATRSPKFRW
ncbi:MAG: aminomethyl-transferring glycine dehydrogenase subunit GcvPB [Planctomycetes bacterium]|nr:aminomethyl-transferring glycine dehydrogenase subunit GcvPB [Planctomycetota bacterium]